MEIVITQEQGRLPVTVIKLKGELDASTFADFQARAKQAIDAGAHNLLIDLSGVPYMSSAGMRALNQIFNWLSGSPAENEAIKKAVATGKVKSPHLKLLNPPARVVDALKLAGYDMFLEIHHNLKDAIASF